jgi:hypothetical protein
MPGQHRPEDPFFRAQGKANEPAVCKTPLPGASPGCASIPLLGHEEDSNPRRSDRRETRSDTGVPDHFLIHSAKA